MNRIITQLYAIFLLLSSSPIIAMQVAEESPAKRARIEEKTQLILLQQFDTVTLEEIKQEYGERPAIFACDFYIDDIETKGKGIEGGYVYENIYNIDHHAPTKRMMSNITATSLAIDYIKKNSEIPQGSVVLINHTDCDSVLSSLIICGLLSVDQEEDAVLYAKAAESADHTGAPNDIADLLQALSCKRKLLFSAKNMEDLLAGKDLDEEAAVLFKQRSDERMRSFALIKGGLRQKGHVTFLQLTPKKNVDIQLLYWALPDAEIIMTAGQMPDDASRTGIKIMRGRKAPNGLCLNIIGLGDGFGGRWDAISNKRAGGTTNSVAIYIDKLNDYLNSFTEYRKEFK
jgi:hypothetical protein